MLITRSNLDGVCGCSSFLLAAREIEKFLPRKTRKGQLGMSIDLQLVTKRRFR